MTGETSKPHQSIDNQILVFSIAAVVLVGVGIAAGSWGIWRLWPISGANADSLGAYL